MPVFIILTWQLQLSGFRSGNLPLVSIFKQADFHKHPASFGYEDVVEGRRQEAAAPWRCVNTTEETEVDSCRSQDVAAAAEFTEPSGIYLHYKKKKNNKFCVDAFLGDSRLIT